MPAILTLLAQVLLYQCFLEILWRSAPIKQWQIIHVGTNKLCYMLGLYVTCLDCRSQNFVRVNLNPSCNVEQATGEGTERVPEEWEEFSKLEKSKTENSKQLSWSKKKKI